MKSNSLPAHYSHPEVYSAEIPLGEDFSTVSQENLQQQSHSEAIIIKVTTTELDTSLYINTPKHTLYDTQHIPVQGGSQGSSQPGSFNVADQAFASTLIPPLVNQATQSNTSSGGEEDSSASMRTRRADSFVGFSAEESSPFPSEPQPLFGHLITSEPMDIVENTPSLFKLSTEFHPVVAEEEFGGLEGLSPLAEKGHLLQYLESPQDLENSGPSNSSVSTTNPFDLTHYHLFKDATPGSHVVGENPEDSSPSSHALKRSLMGTASTHNAINSFSVTASIGVSSISGVTTTTSSRIRVTTSTSKSIDEESGRKKLNQYIMMQPLAITSKSKVRLCYDTHLQIFVAIKVYNKDILGRRGIDGNSLLDSVRQEISIIKTMDHPNVVALLEIIEDPRDKKIYLVMEYMPRGTVQGMDTRLRLEPELVTIRSYFRDIVMGLDYIHENGVLHRDIKPDNLLISSEGRVKIADFGVSTWISNVHTKNATKSGFSPFKRNFNPMAKTKESHSVAGVKPVARTVGTPAFLAPEVCTGKHNVTTAVDVWALGLTLYYMVFEKYPFMKDSLYNTYSSIAGDESIIISHHDSHLESLLRGMLQKDPRHRLTLKQIKAHPWTQWKDGFKFPEKTVTHGKEHIPPGKDVSHFTSKSIISEIWGKISQF